jgi:hypothetical protein
MDTMFLPLLVALGVAVAIGAVAKVLMRRTWVDTIGDIILALLP